MMLHSLTDGFFRPLTTVLALTMMLTGCQWPADPERSLTAARERGALRSEEHTSELQSREKLVCRLLLEKKTLPAIAPGILSGAVLAFIYCFMSFPIVLSLGGARYSTLEVEIFTLMRVLLDYETAAALAAVQAGVSLLFAYVFLRLEGRAPHLFFFA